MTDNEINNVNISVLTYKLIKDMCSEWLVLEQQLSSTDTEKSDVANLSTTLWYNIIDANIFDLKSLDNVFGVSNTDNRILTRFSQLYVRIVYMLGRTAIKNLHKELDLTLKEFGIKNYKEYARKYPFIILIPVFNDIQRNKS